MERTAKPTAGNFQCSERRKQSAGHAARRNPQEAQTPATGQKTARLGTGRSNYGAVVGDGCAFCARHPERYGKGGKGADHCGDVNRPHGFFRPGAEK